MWETDIRNVCRKSGEQPVTKFMHTLREGEYVNEDTHLDTAVHQLITGRHLSLLVTHKKKIVGVLRMSDVFAATFHVMKAVEATE